MLLLILAVNLCSVYKRVDEVIMNTYTNQRLCGGRTLSGDRRTKMRERCPRQF